MPTIKTNTQEIHQENKRLLERYLPPIPDGFMLNWIKSQPLQGFLILDPFGSAPDLSVKVAESGCRILVAANNPVIRLLIEIAANPPSLEQARSALANLASLKVRDERLELHIQSLYKTTCPNCNHEIFAEAFLWEREARVPYAKIIQCEYCEQAGEYELTADDLKKASTYDAGGLHHARALGRVVAPNDLDRIHVEEALNVYPPRAIYALLTVVNKLDVLNTSKEQERIMMAMLLSAFDQANTLWSYPVARERPKQLTIPPSYRENNIWQALEKTLELWNFESRHIPVTSWPDLPPKGGGICLYNGRIKDLILQAEKIEIRAILTAFPRPNQAFWSLSALWAGWLWGQEAVEHFKPVLRRRRYDWAWHTTAMHAAFKSLIPALTDGATINGVIGEAEPGFVSAVIIAADQAGLEFQGIDLYSDKRLAFISWNNAKKFETSSINKANQTHSIRSAGEAYLLSRGEPSSYLHLHIAVLIELVRKKLLISADKPSDNYIKLHQELQKSLIFQNGFLRFDGSIHSLDVGQWWLVKDDDSDLPLSDKIEMEIVDFLIKNSSCTFTDVQTELFSTNNKEFAGLLKPDDSLIYECLDSYCEFTDSKWKFQKQDNPIRRREEIASMVELISGIGEKLGFSAQTMMDNIPKSAWLDENDHQRYVFYVSASALLGKFLLKDKLKSEHNVIVLPGGRANLVMFKLNRDPRLKKFVEQNFSFLKYRHARQLANNPSLIVDNLESQLALDPITYSQTQLRMF